MKYTLLNIKDKDVYMETVLDSLCQNVAKSSDLRDVLQHVIKNKTGLFEGEDFKGSLYEGDDETLDLILPCVRKVWSNFFISPPTLFGEKRLELFQALFDIDDFLDYLVAVFPKVKSALLHFEKLDRASETFSLIACNYAAEQVEKTKKSKDLSADIRDARIKNTLKIIYKN